MAKKYYDANKVDFLQSEQNQPLERSSARPLTKKKSGRTSLILFLSIAAFVLSSFLYVQASASPLSQGLKTFPWLNSLKKLIHSDEQILLGEENDAINILLIGMGGEGHEGAYLADTIILARFQPSTKQVALVSFPRDLAVQIPGQGWRKLNSANAYGGPELITNTLGKVIGEPIPYYVLADFKGFEKIINDLGGIDVYVEKTFIDYEFPAENYQFRTVSFDQGQQHLDGAQALDFARSRHGSNGEGSDFARSARQQKILFAVKDKITSVNTLLNPTKLLTLYNNLVRYIDTNIEPATIVRLTQLAQGTRQSSITSLVITDGPNGLLDPTIGEDGAYLLIPKEGFGKFSSIQDLVANLFNQVEITARPDILPAEVAKPASSQEPARPTVIILNGTTLPGYAAQVANLLQQKNFQIVSTGNHLEQSISQTQIYELNQPAVTVENILATVLTYRREEKITTELKDYLNSLATTTALGELNYLIILGSDNKDLLD